jgi:hypothetical protein
MADTNFKFCTACGRKVALNARFCGGRGAALRGKNNSVGHCTSAARIDGWGMERQRSYAYQVRPPL